MNNPCTWWRGGHQWDKWSEKKQKPVSLRYPGEIEWRTAYDIYQERACKTCGKLDRRYIVEN